MGPVMVPTPPSGDGPPGGSDGAIFILQIEHVSGSHGSHDGKQSRRTLPALIGRLKVELLTQHFKQSVVNTAQHHTASFNDTTPYRSTFHTPQHDIKPHYTTPRQTTLQTSSTSKLLILIHLFDQFTPSAFIR